MRFPVRKTATSRTSHPIRRESMREGQPKLPEPLANGLTRDRNSCANVPRMHANWPDLMLYGRSLKKYGTMPNRVASHKHQRTVGRRCAGGVPANANGAWVTVRSSYLASVRWRILF